MRKTNALKKSLVVLTGVGIGIGLFMGSANAGTDSGTLNLSVELYNSCTIAVTSPAAAMYSGVAGTAHPWGWHAAGMATVTCNNGAAYNICFDVGSHGANGHRNLANADGDLIPYAPAYLNDGGAITGIGDGGCNAVDASYTETFSATPSFAGTYDPAVGGDLPFQASFGIPDTTPAGLYEDSVTVSVVF
jgi:spore coat protein U-like protein